MKSNKKITKIVLLVLFLIAITFGAYYYFKVIYIVDGEARLVEMNLPEESQNIKLAIDEVKIGKLKWKDALLIKGWVFKENVKSEKRDAFMVLESQKQTLIFKIENDSLIRTDVSAAYKLVDGINNHGFVLDIPLYLLKDNNYQIGFVIWDETGKYYSRAQKELQITEGNVAIMESKSNLGSINISNRLSMTLKAPTNQIHYSFDKIGISEDTLTVIGWGFLDGKNTDSLKSYVILKKNDTVSVYSVVVQSRKDVTNAFVKSGLNVDLSGFLSQIRIAKMEKGNYQVGLYLEQGNQTGMVYSDKSIAIGN